MPSIVSLVPARVLVVVGADRVDDSRSALETPRRTIRRCGTLTRSNARPVPTSPDLGKWFWNGYLAADEPRRAASVSNLGESMYHAGCGNPTHSVMCLRRSMAISASKRKKGARYAIPPLSDCESHHPAAIFISSNSSAGMGWCSRQVMDMEKVPGTHL